MGPIEPEQRQEQQIAPASNSGPTLEAKGQTIQLSAFVGEHGAYQLAITALLFVRYVFLGLMANSGPLMTPDVTFYCQLPMLEVLAIMPNISVLSPREQELEIKEEFKRICQIDLHLYHNQSQLVINSTRALRPLGGPSINSTGAGNFMGRAAAPSGPRIRECLDFTYDIAPDQGRTMTSEFDLVCERDWLRSLFQSLLSASIVVAHVFWGTFSDKYGRFQAQRLCLLVSLFAGALSIVAVDFWTFTLARALCSFGDLGLVVSMTTTVVELVGNQYRGLSVALVNFGYALGVSILPYVVAYFEDFRLVVGFTVLCHVATMPFVLAANESVRWLLTNGRFKAARHELKRISRWNRASSQLWQTLVGFVSRRHETQTPDRTNKTTIGQQDKQEFELMFQQLLAQFESHHLCDPLVCASAAEADPDSTCTGDASEPGRQLPLTKLTCPSLSSIEARNEELMTTDDQQQQQPHRTAHVSGQDTHPVGDFKRLAYSCTQLDSVSAGQFHAPGQPNTLRPPLAKTLTLPANMRSLSATTRSDSSVSDFVASQRRRERQQLQMRCQPGCMNQVAQQLSFVTRVSRLFRDKRLMIAVFTIVWTTFNSELQYTSFIIINLEVGEDVYLNYILGGCMEALAAISASLLLSYAPRRHSLITFWLLISLSCFGLSVAHIDSTWAVWLLALAKFSQSCLSSIASVAAYESFPTTLRQSGSGLVFTLGMLGSVFAPLIFAEFDDHAGMDRVLMTFSLSSLTAATLIYLFLTETRNCELQ